MRQEQDQFPYQKKVVTLGGGTGHYHLLRGLVQLNQPEHITAIAGTWDSGGSSGRLRTEMGVLPSGDITQCLIALIENDRKREVAGILLNDRMAEEEGPLKGHSLRNLLDSVAQRRFGGQDRGIDGQSRSTRLYYRQ
jgi:uncharacterized cofD-like protein